VTTKSAARSIFLLSPAELSALPCWRGQVASLSGAVNVVKLFLTRDVERAAHRKFGGPEALQARRAARSTRR